MRFVVHTCGHRTSFTKPASSSSVRKTIPVAVPAVGQSRQRGQGFAPALPGGIRRREFKIPGCNHAVGVGLTGAGVVVRS
jgi:hypothetical protein